MTKIETWEKTVNSTGTLTMPSRPLTLAAGLLFLTAWMVFGFIIPVGVGLIHGLLGVAAVLLVRWWALTH